MIGTVAVVTRKGVVLVRIPAPSFLNPVLPEKYSLQTDWDHSMSDEWGQEGFSPFERGEFTL